VLGQKKNGECELLRLKRSQSKRGFDEKGVLLIVGAETNKRGESSSGFNSLRKAC